MDCRNTVADVRARDNGVLDWAAALNDTARIAGDLDVRPGMPSERPMTRGNGPLAPLLERLASHGIGHGISRAMALACAALQLGHNTRRGFLVRLCPWGHRCCCHRTSHNIALACRHRRQPSRAAAGGLDLCRSRRVEHLAGGADRAVVAIAYSSRPKFVGQRL